MSVTVDTESLDEAVIIMTRTFDAPREKVWEALTNPEHVKHWFGGHGFTNRVEEMDVRPGGRWRQVMRTPDGSEFPLEFIYVEVVRPVLLSWQDIDHGRRAAGPPTRLNIVTLEAVGAKTKWKMVAKFNSLAERDATKATAFADVIAQGCEKLEAIAKTL
jgi:uncharacterized protein YndB with AHSA1/START domain